MVVFAVIKTILIKRAMSPLLLRPLFCVARTANAGETNANNSISDVSVPRVINFSSISSTRLSLIVVVFIHYCCCCKRNGKHDVAKPRISQNCFIRCGKMGVVLRRLTQSVRSLHKKFEHFLFSFSFDAIFSLLIRLYGVSVLVVWSVVTVDGNEENY